MAKSGGADWGAALLYLAGMAGCSTGEMPRPQKVEFASIFERTQTIALEELPEDPIAWITDVARAPDGVIVTDQVGDKVVRFNSEGQLAASIGGKGDGPGEFRGPLAVAWESDTTLVVVDGAGRLTLLDADLDLMGVFRVDGTPPVRGVTSVHGDVVLTTRSPRAGDSIFWSWSPGTGASAPFDPRSPLVDEVPYWYVAFTSRVGSTSDWIFVADNMTYPLRMYSPGRELQDSVGTPPPSWVQARRPEAGEFTTFGPGSEMRAFLRSFTSIDRLAVIEDRFLLVSHRYPVGEYRDDDTYALDVYDTSSGAVVKLWEDVLPPGRLLAVHGCAWFVEGTPPDPWTLACYRLKDSVRAGT